MATRPAFKLPPTDALDDLTEPMTAVQAETLTVTPNVTPESNAPPPQPKAPKAASTPAAPNRNANKKELEKQAREFGKADGAGKRSFVQFARLLVKGGADKTLSPSAKSPDSNDMYRAFATASITAAGGEIDPQTGEITKGGVMDDKKASYAAQLSKVRAFIRLGKFYEDEAESIFDDASEIHRTIMATPELSERVKLRSTYAAICSIAVAQTKGASEKSKLMRLSVDQIKGLLLNEPVEKREKTGADYLIEALNLIESAMRGRAPSDNHGGRSAIVSDDLSFVVDTLRGVIGQVDAPALADRDAKIEEMRQKKIAAAEKKAKAEEEAAEKARQKIIEEGLKSGNSLPVTAKPESDEDEEQDVEEGFSDDEMFEEEPVDELDEVVAATGHQHASAE